MINHWCNARNEFVKNASNVHSVLLLNITETSKVHRLVQVHESIISKALEFNFMQQSNSFIE